MKALKLEKILRPFEEKWVALNRRRTEVLASGDDPQKVSDLAKQKSNERPILMFMSPFDMDFVS